MPLTSKQFIERAATIQVTVDKLGQEAANVDTSESFLKIRYDLSLAILEMKSLYTALEDGTIFLEECKQLESYIEFAKPYGYNRRQELLKGYANILHSFIQYIETYKS